MTDHSSLPSSPAPSPGSLSEPETIKGQILEHFMRHESGRLYGSLTRSLGPSNLSLVEDVVQGALLQALRTWSADGIPPNPSAWISRVAMNLARDALRHRKMSASKEQNIVVHLEQTRSAENDGVDDETTLRDDALRLMFVCCHPEIAPDAQVILALKTLCGFNNAEIARAFLSSEAAIEKQLTRTKQRIREANIGFVIPETRALPERLEGVLATLYLLFNEGYKATAGERLLREDLCREALRLVEILVSHPAGSVPRAHALRSLMLLNAARFPARVGSDGEILRLQGQDRGKWDQRLIERGLRSLASAAEGSELSDYHLEAAIAACHCTADTYERTDWPRIVRLYDALLARKPSPVVALNRVVALAEVSGPVTALAALDQIPERNRLEKEHLYHAVRADLHVRAGDHRQAVTHLRMALSLAQVVPERDHLARRLAEAEQQGAHQP